MFYLHDWAARIPAVSSRVCESPTCTGSCTFLRHRGRLNKHVLRPIADMTAAADKMSANNLSDRINLAGTKNEFKDLAAVINKMLDRIERSYNSQKQFVSDASHELRTPIAVIQGYANMLERWGKTDTSVLDEGITAIYAGDGVDEGSRGTPVVPGAARQEVPAARIGSISIPRRSYSRSSGTRSCYLRRINSS